MKEGLLKYLVYSIIIAIIYNISKMIISPFLNDELILQLPFLSFLIIALLYLLISMFNLFQKHLSDLVLYTFLLYIALILSYFAKYLRFEFGLINLCLNENINKENVFQLVYLEGFTIILTTLIFNYIISNKYKKSLYNKQNLIYTSIVFFIIIVFEILKFRLGINYI